MITKGEIYFATGIEQNVFAFVPDYCITNGTCNPAYLSDGWASLNNTNQIIPRGSHVWPDLAKPITERNSLVEAFLKKFDSILP